MHHKRSNIKIKRKDMARMSPLEVSSSRLRMVRLWRAINTKEDKVPGRDAVVKCWDLPHSSSTSTAQLQWLNDELVNLYISLLLERDADRRKRVRALEGVGHERGLLGLSCGRGG